MVEFVFRDKSLNRVTTVPQSFTSQANKQQTLDVAFKDIPGSENLRPSMEGSVGPTPTPEPEPEEKKTGVGIFNVGQQGGNGNGPISKVMDRVQSARTNVRDRIGQSAIGQRSGGITQRIANFRPLRNLRNRG